MNGCRTAGPVVFLDPRRVDVTSCAAVMGHIRGCLLYTTAWAFLSSPPEILVDVDPSEMPVLVRHFLPPGTRSINGARIPLRDDALVWNDITAAELVARIASRSGICVVFRREDWRQHSIF